MLAFVFPRKETEGTLCMTVQYYASLKFTQLQFDARVVCSLLSPLAQLPELGTGERHLEPGRHSGQEQDSRKELPLRLTGKIDGCENGEPKSLLVATRTGS